MPIRVFTEEEKEKLKNSMLEQGIPLIIEFGLKHMSVSKITEEVGIGKSTFYNFFESKEDFIIQAMEWNRKRLLDGIDQMFPDGKKMEPEQFFQLIFERILSSSTVFRNFSAEDERFLYEAEKKRGKDVSLERETMIQKRLFSHVKGVREDLNYGVIANYVKLIVLGYENAYLFHPSAMEEMQTELRIHLVEMIFKDGYRERLIKMLKENDQ